MTALAYNTIAPEIQVRVPGAPTAVVADLLNLVVIDLCERAKVWRVPGNPFPLVPGVWQYQIATPTLTGLTVEVDEPLFMQLTSLETGSVDTLDPVSQEDLLRKYPAFPDTAHPAKPNSWMGYDSISVNVMPTPDAPSTVLYYYSDTSVTYTQTNGTVTVTLVSNTAPAPTVNQQIYLMPLGSPGLFAGIYTINAVTSANLFTCVPTTVPLVTPPNSSGLLAPVISPYMVTPWLSVRPTQAATAFEQTIYTQFRRAIQQGVWHELMMMPGKPWADEKKALFHGKQWEYLLREARVRANKGFNRAPTQVAMRSWG